jgi:hypothetical protein
MECQIESRIRSAFGIQGYEDASNNNFVPIIFSSLVEEIRPHLSQIQFTVDFNDLVKVYKWSNFYLHAGWRDFVWVPGYALQFLRPLFADTGRTPSGGWSINGGVRMPRAVWRNIRAAFERPNRRSGRMARIWEAVRNFVLRRAKRRLVLNSADENKATCVFLD